MKLTITQVIDFINNYPSDFIEKCWEHDPLLAWHLREKLSHFFDIYTGPTASPIVRFLSDLSESNREVLSGYIAQQLDETPAKYAIRSTRDGVAVVWDDRSVAVRSSEPLEGSRTTEVRFMRPAEGISLNHTVGHMIAGGNSITAVGLTDEAVEALELAINHYKNRRRTLMPVN